MKTINSSKTTIEKDMERYVLLKSDLADAKRDSVYSKSVGRNEDHERAEKELKTDESRLKILETELTEKKPSKMRMM